MHFMHVFVPEERELSSRRHWHAGHMQRERRRAHEGADVDAAEGPAPRVHETVAPDKCRWSEV